MARQLPPGWRDGEGIVCAFPQPARRGPAPGQDVDGIEGVEVVARFGGVVTLLVRVGDEVAEGDAIAIIELTKLEAVVPAPVSGRIVRLAIPPQAQVDGGSLLLVIG